MVEIVVIDQNNDVILFMPHSLGYRPFPHAESIQKIECMILAENKKHVEPYEWQNVITPKS